MRSLAKWWNIVLNFIKKIHNKNWLRIDNSPHPISFLLSQTCLNKIPCSEMFALRGEQPTWKFQNQLCLFLHYFFFCCSREFDFMCKIKLSQKIRTGTLLLFSALRTQVGTFFCFPTKQSKKRREGESPVWLRRESKVSFCFYFYNFFFFAGKLEVWALVFALGLVWKSGSGNSHKWKSIHGAFQPWTQTEEAICNTYCLIICLRFYHTWCPFSL